MVRELLRNNELENMGERQEENQNENQKIDGNGKNTKKEWSWNRECE